MNSKSDNKIKASDIAAFLGLKMHGKDILVNEVKALSQPCANALVFSKKPLTHEMVTGVENVCFITPDLPAAASSNTFIVTTNPRLAFAKAVTHFFVQAKTEATIGQNSIIDATAQIGASVSVGSGCVIGENVTIGDGTRIRHHVVIGNGTKIGENCLIRSGAVIGDVGYGFEFEKDGTPVRMPHLGSVEIKDFVEIGNFTSIARGTLGNTIIHSHVKIDNLVHIAHNCVIGSKTLVIACAEISGSVTIGEKCWLGPNCSVMNQIKIADRTLIGLGAVVRKDTILGAVMAGNPAKLLRVQE